jgi:ferritin
MNEFNHKAFEHLEEEIEDACEYLKEADEAEADGRAYLARGMKDIAMEEYSHAHFLREYLISRHAYYEHPNFEKVDQHWHRLLEKFGFKHK